jgi:hypothetical protein
MKMNCFNAVLGAAIILAASLTTTRAISTPYEVPGTGQDIAKNGTGPGGGNGNDPASDFFRLQTVIDAWNAANPSNLLPTPVFAGVTSGPENETGTSLLGFTYAVLHYGTGPGGTSGGGVEIWYLNGAANFDFPSTGSGPNGNGGFSSLYLYDASVPDGATTAMLLGGSLTVLGLIRRKLSA